MTNSLQFFRFSYRKNISETCMDKISRQNSYIPRQKRGPLPRVSSKRLICIYIRNLEIYTIFNHPKFLNEIISKMQNIFPMEE